MEDKGEVDETNWNNTSVERVRDMTAGQLSLPDMLELYIASKTLAEKGKQTSIKQITLAYFFPTIQPLGTFMRRIGVLLNGHLLQFFQQL